MSDLLRVDVLGVAVYVRSTFEVDHLTAVNQKLAKMKLALHKIKNRGAPKEFEDLAREGLS